MIYCQCSLINSYYQTRIIGPTTCHCLSTNMQFCTSVRLHISSSAPPSNVPMLINYIMLLFPSIRDPLIHPFVSAPSYYLLVRLSVRPSERPSIRLPVPLFFHHSVRPSVRSLIYLPSMWVNTQQQSFYHNTNIFLYISLIIFVSQYAFSLFK